MFSTAAVGLVLFIGELWEEMYVVRSEVKGEQHPSCERVNKEMYNSEKVFSIVSACSS